MEAKYGAELTDVSCERVQVGSATLPDGTVRPIYEAKAVAPKAYRRLVEIVSNSGHHVTE